MANVEKIRAVVFDLDGVLLDTETINVRAAFDAFAAVGHPLVESDAAAIVGRHPVDYVPELMLRRDVPPSLRDRLRGLQDERYATLWRDNSRLLPGAVAAVRFVRQRGLGVGLATSSGRATVAEALVRFAMRDAFDVILTKDDVGARKPDPEIYLRAAASFGIVPRAMVVVEDSAYGIAAARAAGARCVAMRTAHTPEVVLFSADAVLDSLLDLPGLLSSWGLV
jgi:HAD superfamily hydrolase (TIGR01509 family)